MGQTFNGTQIVCTGNETQSFGVVNGALDAIVISNDGTTPNVARTVTITVTLAEGFTQQFGPLAIAAGQSILHPRKQAVAADLSTAVAGVFDRWHLNGKVSVTVASANAGDKTRVKLVMEP